MKELSAAETKARFNVEIPIKVLPDSLTEAEERNVKTVLSYMRTAYSYELNTGASSVQELSAPGSTFSAPSTFPAAHTPPEYAESHSKVLRSLQDLHIVHFDIVIAKENFVSLRYTAEGTHEGQKHADVEPSGKHAQWTAQGSFILDESSGKIKHWWKDWDKMRMWKSLGWVKPVDAEFA